MNIAFILYQFGVISGRSNGVRSQALTAADLLRNEGHTCTLVNNWEHYKWDDFDVIHIYGYDVSIYDFIKSFKTKNSNIYISPIIDSNKSYFSYKLASFNGFSSLRLLSSNYALRKALTMVKGVFVRSEHEKQYIIKSLGVSLNKVHVVQLPYGIEEPLNIDKILKDKENYCFHVSSLYQGRKNVKRLILAAKKYGFHLKLAGSTGSNEDLQNLKDLIGDCDHIEILGFVSEKELIDLYAKAKVFALPSLNEGVGIVALDAALYGCNLLITNLKGPSSYYPESVNVEVVDPFKVNEIGEGVLKLLNIENNLSLHNYMLDNYSSKIIYKKNIQVYIN